MSELLTKLMNDLDPYVFMSGIDENGWLVAMFEDTTLRIWDDNGVLDVCENDGTVFTSALLIIASHLRPSPMCTCGHLEREHLDDENGEPTMCHFGTCTCKTFTERPRAGQVFEWKQPVYNDDGVQTGVIHRTVDARSDSEPSDICFACNHPRGLHLPNCGFMTANAWATGVSLSQCGCVMFSPQPKCAKCGRPRAIHDEHADCINPFCGCHPFVEPGVESHGDSQEVSP